MGKGTVQSVLFDKQLWNLKSSRSWLKINGFLYDVKPDKRGNYYKFHQINFDPDCTYRSRKSAVDGIKYVYKTSCKSNCPDLINQETNTTKKGGEASFDLHSVLPKVPLNPPGFKYLGPNNDLNKQVDLKTGIPRKGFEPDSNLDKIALKHDLLYHKAEEEGTDKADILRRKHEADKIFVKEAEAAPSENFYQKFWNWLSRNIIKAKMNLGFGMSIEELKSNLDNMSNFDDLLKFLVEQGVITNMMLKQAMKHTSMDKIRKQHKKIMMNKKKTRRGGELILGIISLITAIIVCITKIVELVAQREAIAAQEREEERRKHEQEKAENEAKQYELKQMLYDYDVRLKQLAAEGNLPIKDYILLNLKNQDSEVNDMKKTILTKAKEFNMTHSEFVDYCMNIAGTNSWFAVLQLLKIMKTELNNPNYINETVINISDSKKSTLAAIEYKPNVNAVEFKPDSNKLKASTLK